MEDPIILQACEDCPELGRHIHYNNEIILVADNEQEFGMMEINGEGEL